MARLHFVGIHPSGGNLRVLKYHCGFSDNAWMLATTLALSKSMMSFVSMQTDHWLFNLVHLVCLEILVEMWQPPWLMYTWLYKHSILNTLFFALKAL
jgi:hypothetical protein